MISYKRYFIALLFYSFLFMGMHLFLLILVDPLNISPLELTKNEFFIKEMRFQSAPIINKFDFDSAIVGTSMAENFDAAEASNKLGGKFQNLSLSGSLLKERKVLLDYLLSSKKIKTIIISLDGVSSTQRNKGIPIKAYSFLYNDNYLDDLTLYYNRKYTPYISCHSLFNNKVIEFLYGKCPDNKIRTHIEDLTEWQSMQEHNNRFGGVDKWIAHKENEQVARSIKNINNAAILIQKKETNSTSGVLTPSEFTLNIIPLIKKYPDTKFILFFPPYSIFKYAVDAQTKPNAFSKYLSLVKKVVFESELYPNAEVYWFGNNKFLSDIANYKDLTHYHAKFNSIFLDHFKDGKSLINISNYKQLIGKFKDKATSVDLVSLSKDLTPIP